MRRAWPALLRQLWWMALGLALSLPAGAQDAGTLRVGSKRFTESYILAEVLAQTAAPHLSAPPVLRQGLGNTAIVYEALHSGGIDLYAEYTGTIALEILKQPGPMSLENLRAALAPLGLGLAVPLGFNDGYALAMRAADADRLGIRTLADLARHPELRLGLSNEFLGRADGWKGLAGAYGLAQAPTALDHGLAYDAIAASQIDAIDIYTTDARIDHLGLRVLVDDRGFFPRYDAMLLHRLDLPTRLPKAWAALQKLEGRIDERAMVAMNARAELEGAAFDVIARDFLAGGPRPASAARGFTAKLVGPDLWPLARQHLLLVAASVGFAILLAVPLGVAVFSRLRLRALVLGAAGLLQTVPSLALLAMLISLLGVIGTLPELLAGVRTATTIAIGTATIAAFIGAGGFGERIVTGLALNDRELLLAGALPAAALALLGELLFEDLEWMLRRR